LSCILFRPRDLSITGIRKRPTSSPWQRDSRNRLGGSLYEVLKTIEKGNAGRLNVAVLVCCGTSVG